MFVNECLGNWVVIYSASTQVRPFCSNEYCKIHVPSEIRQFSWEFCIDEAFDEHATILSRNRNVDQRFLPDTVALLLTKNNTQIILCKEFIFVSFKSDVAKFCLCSFVFSFNKFKDSYNISNGGITQTQVTPDLNTKNKITCPHKVKNSDI